MAWLFVPALPVLISDSPSWCPITVPSCTWRGKPLSPRAWSRAWMRASWLRRLSGTTWLPSTAASGVATWIASQPVFRVSRGAQREEVPASATTDGSGRISGNEFAKWNRGLCIWKTFLPLFPEEDWPWFSATWPASGSMRNGICSRPLMSVHRIDESDCSYWPTAVDADCRSSGREKSIGGAMHPGTTLTDAVRRWPATAETPNQLVTRERTGRAPCLGEAWPTPVARDYRTPNTAASQQRRSENSSRGQQLPNVVAHLWATPVVPNGGRTLPNDELATLGGMANGKRQVDLGTQVRLWATPRAEDAESCGGHSASVAGDSLTCQTRLWPTPAAMPYGSSQNGINGLGGENERPSAQTPSLERMSRCFLPLLETFMDGEGCSASGPSSRRPSQWKTPHDLANTDRFGRTGGGGGELHKQATKQAPVKARLNANFVEWLMGWPIGWTASALAATEWYHWRQRMRLSLWRFVRASGIARTSGAEERV
jgi:hypothetical protein